MGPLTGVIGGVSGALQGGVLGGALGLASGLFGGDASQSSSSSQFSRTTNKFEEITGERKELLDGLMSKIPALLEQLTPEKRAEMIGNLEQKYGKAFTDNIKQSFDKQRGQVTANLARTGTGPASVNASLQGELAKQEGVAINKAEADASIMAENIGSATFGQFANTAGNMASQTLGIFNSRRQTESTTTGTGGSSTTMANSQLDELIGLGFEGLTDEGSFLNQGGFSDMFGKDKDFIGPKP